MSDRSIPPQLTVKWPQIVAALSAAGGALAVGAALGWPSPAGPRLVEGDDKYFPIEQSAFDWASSIVTIGCAISCLPIGFLMTKFGRKWTMISLVVPFLIGWGLVAWAQNFAMLLIGRLMLGVAGGAFCVSSPQYSAEIAEKEIRGIVGTFFQVLINVGILFVYVVGAFVTVFWTNIICAIIPIVFGVVFFFMPESPVYLVTQKRDEDAIKCYKWLRGSAYDPKAEMDELKKEVEENQRKKISFGEVLKRKSGQRALFIGFGLMFFQQMCGINVVIFNSTTIFEAAKTGINSDYQTIIIGSVLLIATIAGTLLVERLGRKILLVISSTLMTLMLVALGIYFYLLEMNPAATEKLAWLPLTALCVHLVAYSIGYGPLPWLLLSEIYSKEYNAIASPITGAFAWALAFAVTVSFGYIKDSIGMGPTFWMFGVLSTVGLFFSYIVIIETKAKTLAQIQKELEEPMW